MLEAVRQIDPLPLSIARPPPSRLLGNCRHHTVLATALLRRHGAPARGRCGFGLYFNGRPVDHWVVEYWHAKSGGWRLGDAQLDDLQRKAVRLPFDPLDTPRDAFLVAGEAWRRCRAGEADPADFGILDMHGLWFVAGNLVRDIAALNGMEMLPWDIWGPMFRAGETPSAEQLAALDAAAELSRAPDEHWEALKALYRDRGWCVPATVWNEVAQRTDVI
jgi:Transglutaminase-like superfamily